MQQTTVFASALLPGLEPLKWLLERAARVGDWVAPGRPAQARGQTFLHRPIAARQFLRRSEPAGGIEPRAAALENGLSKIDLARPAVQPSVRDVEITTGGLS